MPTSDTGHILRAQPSDPIAFARDLCCLVLGASKPINVRAVPNTRHLLFQVHVDDTGHALKILCGDHEAWAAEVLVRKDLSELRSAPIRFAGEYKSCGYLFMEWIDGRSLAKLLDDADNNVVDQVFACAGHQLAVMHQVDASKYKSGIALSPAAGDAPIRDLERHLNLVSNQFGRQLCNEIVGAVRLFAEEMASYRELVIAHGDYQPKNLLRCFHDDELYVLDWEFLSLSSKWADLSQLLRHAPNESAVLALQNAYSRCCPLPPNWQQLARVFDLTRISMGIARSPESSDLPDWIRLVQELVRGARDRSAPSTYEAAAFLRL